MTKPKDEQPDLPGVDREIKPLEVVAAAYAKLRDQRISIGEQEVALKRQALSLMRRLHKTRYRRDGIDIELLPGEESIRVKVAKVTTEKNGRRGNKADAAPAAE